MTTPAAHKWTFAPRFRRDTFGWRSQPALQRVREAVAEIPKVAKKDQTLASAGAVLFLERLSPALEQFDSCDPLREFGPSEALVFGADHRSDQRAPVQADQSLVVLSE